MASVFWKRTEWFAQWYRSDGSRAKQRTGTDKRREAERIAAELEAADRKKERSKDDLASAFRKILELAAADANRGRLDLDRAKEHLNDLVRVANPEFRILSLSEHLAAWCEEQKPRVEESTAKAYADMVRRFTKAFGAKICAAPVGDLTREQVTTAFLKLVAGKAKVRASTANLDLRALRRALTEAVHRKLATVNPAAGIRPLPENDSTEKAPFEAHEVRAMIDHEATTPEWKGLILFGAHTGLRLGDAVKLGSANIEGTDIVIRPKKTQRSKKTIRIPLTPPLLAWVQGKKGHFFPHLRERKGGTLSTTFRRIMKSAEVAAEVTLPGGVAARRSFHSLRHSFTSWLAEADIHADVRQKLTGHSSAGIHAKYTHHDETLKRAIEVLPELSVRKDA